MKTKWRYITARITVPNEAPNWTTIVKAFRGRDVKVSLDAETQTGYGTVGSVKFSFDSNTLDASPPKGWRKSSKICSDLRRIIKSVVADDSVKSLQLVLDSALEFEVDPSERGDLHNLSQEYRDKIVLPEGLKLDFTGFRLYIADDQSRILNVVQVTPGFVRDTRVLCQVESFNLDVDISNVDSVLDAWQELMDVKVPKLITNRREQNVPTEQQGVE